MEENYFLLVLDSNIDNLLQSHFRVFRPLMLEIYPKPLNPKPFTGSFWFMLCFGAKGLSFRLRGFAAFQSCNGNRV